MTKRLIEKSSFLVPLALVALVLEVGVRFKVFPRYLVASPTMIAECLQQDYDILLQAFGQTLGAATLGFLGSLVVGFSLGVLFFWSRRVRRFLFPYVTFFQTIPIIAIAPLLVIWFGYGFSTIAISSLIVAVFPMIAATMKGLASTDPSYQKLFEIYGATRWQSLTALHIPFSLTHIAVGAQVASGLCVIGAIVGEFIAGGGLGGLIDTARVQQRTELLFAALLLSAALGLLMLWATNAIFRRLLKTWHPSERPL